MSSVIGLVRFSYVAERDTSYQTTRNRSLDERLRIILDPKRLERRFRLFEAICLPSLIAQPPESFSAVMLTSEAMPAAYADRLNKLLAPHPNLHAVFAAPGSTDHAMSEAVQAIRPEGGMKMTFRLDDDDAISTDYTAKVLRWLQERYDGHCLSFLRGVGLCKLYGQVRLWDREKPFVSAGLGLINRAEAFETIHDCGNHNRVSETFPTLIDSSFHAYLQSTHGANDSFGHVPAAAYVWPGATMSLKAGRARFGESFPFLEDRDFRLL